MALTLGLRTGSATARGQLRERCATGCCWVAVKESNLNYHMIYGR